jgi:uncharacterized membrane protein (DUF106 family)
MTSLSFFELIGSSVTRVLSPCEGLGMKRPSTIGMLLASVTLKAYLQMPYSDKVGAKQVDNR